MSADNGVYILETPTHDGGKEYRVAHLQAVENYGWGRCPVHGSDMQYGGNRICQGCRDNSQESDDPKVHIQNAREMWRRSEVYEYEWRALAEAMRIYRELDICEYGISVIEIPEVF